LSDSVTAAFLLAYSHRRILELQADLSLSAVKNASSQAVVATGNAVRLAEQRFTLAKQHYDQLLAASSTGLDSALSLDSTPRIPHSGDKK
jgi:hypothetical protein